MIVLYAILLISTLGILKVLNKLQTVFFLTFALIYYLMKITKCRVLMPHFDENDAKELSNAMNPHQQHLDGCDCVTCKIPKDVYIANRKRANFPPLNVNDSYGWGDPAFSSAGGGANSKIEMPEVGNKRFAWKPPTPEWYGW
jgi:hypothetical protein